MVKKVIVVIVNWNRKDAVRNLLYSLRKIDFPVHKLIVVDNASTDGSVEMLKKEFSQEIVLVENETNLGGTGGFNTGMNKALEYESDYIWLLDNDVEVEKEALSGLVTVAERDNNIGIVGSAVCYLEYRNYIFDLGGYFNWSRGMLKPNKRNCLYDRSNLEEVYEVDYCATCSLLVNTALLRKVGIMDENFFLTGDDLEWTYRFKRNGYRVVATPLSRVYHATKIVISPLYMYYNCRNTFYLYSKYNPEKGWARSAKFFNFFLYSFLLGEAKDYSFNDLSYVYTESLDKTFAHKMGKADLKPLSFSKKGNVYKKEILDGLKGSIIINSVDVEDEVVLDIFNLFLREGNAKFLIRNDKKRLVGYEPYIFSYDYKNLGNLLKMLLFRKFDWAVCFEEQRGMTLAALLAKKVIILTKDGRAVTKSLSKGAFVENIVRALFDAVRLYGKFKNYE